MQRHAYNGILEFMKSRDSKPIQEEKQILDGLKIILDNGWTVSTGEILDFMETLQIKKKLSVREENLKFMEFIYLLSRLFKLDVTLITDYFGL